MVTLRKRHTNSPLGHSADVLLRLHVAEQVIPLRQTCSSAIKLRNDVDITPGPARLEIVTDGVSRISDINITGRQPNSLWLNIAMK